MDGFWNDHFKSKSKDIALGKSGNNNIAFGKEVYLSPIVLSSDKRDKNFYRWSVMEFKKEYNVFVERIKKEGGVQRTFAQSFKWKESAIKFALEMLLVCTGRMKRGGGISSKE